MNKPNSRISDILHPRVPRDQQTYHELTSSGTGAIGWAGLVLVVIAVVAVLSVLRGAIRSQPEPMSPGEASEIITARIQNDLGPDMGSVSSPRPKAGAVGITGVVTTRQLTPASSRWKPITFSVYSDYYDGRRAADGSRFSQAEYTCASNSHKLGTRLDLRVGRVTLSNVKVTDRLAKRFTGRRIDLSRAAWNDLSERKAPGLLKGEYRSVPK